MPGDFIIGCGFSSFSFAAALFTPIYGKRRKNNADLLLPDEEENSKTMRTFSILIEMTLSKANMLRMAKY